MRPRWLRRGAKYSFQVPERVPAPESSFIKFWTLQPGHSLVIRSSIRKGDKVYSAFDMYGKHRFEWPEKPGSHVEAADFNPNPNCGGGLHGLEWGLGLRGYLASRRSADTVFQVVDVAEEDIVRIGIPSYRAKTNPPKPEKVKFRKGVLIYSGEYEGAVQLIADHTPKNDEAEAEIRSLSVYPHRMYALGPAAEMGAKYEDAMDGRVQTENLSGADLISSEITGLRHLDDVFPGERIKLDENNFIQEIWDGDPLDPGERVSPGFNTVALDIDFPCKVIPSSTPGHFHLYIDKPMPWSAYQRLLRAFAQAGLVEPGYVRASIHRKATHLRVPNRPKETEDCI